MFTGFWLSDPLIEYSVRSDGIVKNSYSKGTELRWVGLS